ncbi:MAG: hypothetical protein A3F84_18485 [Candidatus Handelsmanbacteria bacterium RIFCSPLOWO2_12_FULL_64_10]|uniref:Amidohydrolase-related domain-containing protein n=1 Tax=Handelsmanbacteria sp. (strain RIFCSPLOWO2_12_FULL_64_10) TaxID=1817868 RepID=A0A1F6C981_HANXR|nr:MAG: hypothetical protein A3F84_18485 [Candidatus Handelsmanbacteria bacterium RIFCSPLOWO2_12_FULL_64_10]
MLIDVNAWLGVWPFRSLKDNTPEALVARLDRSGIDIAAVSLIEAIFHRNVQPANEKLAKAVQPCKDRLLPMATLNPTYPAWEDDLAACHEKLGMKGVRLFPQYHGYPIDGPLGRQVVEACRERNLPVFIPHRIEDARERHWMDPGKTVDLGAVAGLIAAVPGATVVVPNARGVSGSDLWQRTDLRDRPWYVDLSLWEPNREFANFLNQGGASHLLFGTHLPFSYAGSALVKRATLPLNAEGLADVSYRNAAKIFGLKPQAA